MRCGDFKMVHQGIGSFASHEPISIPNNYLKIFDQPYKIAYLYPLFDGN